MYGIFLSLYAIVIVSAFFGNLFIILTLGTRKRELKLPRNMLIINLAVADLRKLLILSYKYDTLKF